MHSIEHTYISLLADIARLSGFSEIRGSYNGLQWCLHEAPKLEKMVLASLELGTQVPLESFPKPLHRLVVGAVTDPIKLRYLRQLLLFCYKAYVPHDKPTTEKAFEAFISTNDTVRKFGCSLSRESPVLLDRARAHCQSVLHKCRFSEIKPSHGPGAVTTSKERWEHWYSSIEYLYPYSDYMSLYFNQDHAAILDDCQRPEHIEAKLIAVPKDTRGPRLICVHPAEAIWIQQGVRRQLERAISLNRQCYGPWPRGHIHFNDQSVNGKIAFTSSRSRRYATIDMKEASDRISEPLVQALFGSQYKWFGCCRAQKYVIPKLGSHVNLRGDLHCYAPMGNATTFPVQSLVFWAICVASLQRHGFHQPGAVFVFGDDIILPTECVEFVIDDLESFGLLVNRTKSFWRGGFRESCGVDAFNGVDVTPVRWKLPVDTRTLTDLQSLSDLGMRLRISGYEEAAATVYCDLRSLLFHLRNVRSLPTTNDVDHGGIAEYVDLHSVVWRDAYWHRDTQQYVSPVYRLEEVSQVRTSHDWNHVLESVCSLERTGHGEIPDRSSSRGTRLNRGWTRVR